MARGSGGGNGGGNGEHSSSQKGAASLSLRTSMKTHDDFPLPVAPMMAFRPGFMSPLADGRKTS